MTSLEDCKELTVQIDREYAAKPDALFSAIADGTAFRLTGATEVTMDFREGGRFYLDFGLRNKKHCFIEGHFTQIIPNKQVTLIWNVEGFRAVSDNGTLVSFTIVAIDHTSKLELRHEKIMTRESADGKKQGWTVVLDGLAANILRM